MKRIGTFVALALMSLTLVVSQAFACSGRSSSDRDRGSRSEGTTYILAAMTGGGASGGALGSGTTGDTMGGTTGDTLGGTAGSTTDRSMEGRGTTGSMNNNMGTMNNMDRDNNMGSGTPSVTPGQGGTAGGMGSGMNGGTMGSGSSTGTMSGGGTTAR